MLLDRFKLKEADLYKVNGPLTMSHLLPLIANEAFAKLKDRPFIPAYDPDLPPHGDVWQLLRRKMSCFIIPTSHSTVSSSSSRLPRPTRWCWPSR